MGIGVCLGTWMSFSQQGAHHDIVSIVVLL